MVAPKIEPLSKHNYNEISSITDNLNFNGSAPECCSSMNILGLSSVDSRQNNSIPDQFV